MTDFPSVSADKAFRMSIMRLKMRLKRKLKALEMMTLKIVEDKAHLFNDK